MNKIEEAPEASHNGGMPVGITMADGLCILINRINVHKAWIKCQEVNEEPYNCNNRYVLLQ